MKSVRALLAEDNPDDVELVVHELGRAGFECEWKVVDNAEAFRRALDEGTWDIILADFTMPRFTALAALEILKSSGKDIPFIIVSGSVGEPIAVEAMKAGAHDFFPKTNVTRLGQAIEREIRESKVRNERQHALTQLRRAEERYRLIVENVRDYAIFMLDANGAVASWNDGAERLTGYAEAEIIGRPLASFFPAEERDAGAPDEQLRVAGEHGSHVGEGRRIRQDGSSFWAMCTLDRIPAQGQLVGYSAILRDVTERKRLLDDLRQAVRARDEFLSIASHELKTPLTPMKLQLERLEKLRNERPHLQLADEEVSKRLLTIERQAERLTALVNNLLDVTRITSGGLELHRETLDLVEVASAVVARMRDAIERSGCQVSIRAQTPVVSSWDRLRLETMLANLLSNALKYGPDGRVDIAIERDQTTARVSVRDRGIGISEAEQARIFERFERAVPERHYGGLGLGLWIVRQVVEAHGGFVRVDSKPNQGSTFTVELPIKEEWSSE